MTTQIILAVCALTAMVSAGPISEGPAANPKANEYRSGDWYVEFIVIFFDITKTIANDTALVPSTMAMSLYFWDASTWMHQPTQCTLPQGNTPTLSPLKVITAMATIWVALLARVMAVLMLTTISAADSAQLNLTRYILKGPKLD
jgi:hypothetical protein